MLIDIIQLDIQIPDPHIGIVDAAPRSITTPLATHLADTESPAHQLQQLPQHTDFLPFTVSSSAAEGQQLGHGRVAVESH